MPFILLVALGAVVSGQLMILAGAPIMWILQEYFTGRWIRQLGQAELVLNANELVVENRDGILDLISYKSCQGIKTSFSKGTFARRCIMIKGSVQLGSGILTKGLVSQAIFIDEAFEAPSSIILDALQTRLLDGQSNMK